MKLAEKWLNQQHKAEMQAQTVKKRLLLTWHKALKRSSFPKRQWLVNKPDYEWFSCLQAENQSLADLSLNGLFSPGNVMALKMTRGSNHWHRLPSKLWPGFPGRRNWGRLKHQEVCNKQNSALHSVVRARGMACAFVHQHRCCRRALCSLSSQEKANESYRMKSYLKNRPCAANTQQVEDNSVTHLIVVFLLKS